LSSRRARRRHAASISSRNGCPWPFDIARFDAPNTEQLGAVAPGPAENQAGWAAQDVGHLRDRLHIADGGRAAIETDIMETEA
jgi:hypothetical protein